MTKHFQVLECKQNKFCIIKMMQKLFLGGGEWYLEKKNVKGLLKSNIDEHYLVSGKRK